MSELFETDEENVLEDFQEVTSKRPETPSSNLDARRRLENMLEDKRLQDELNDFLE